LLSWLIETDAFQLPQLHKHLTLHATLFGHMLQVLTGQNAGVHDWLVKVFAGQKTKVS
jgi:hypothetical protein